MIPSDPIDRAIFDAYGRYAADPRTGGPDGWEAFRDAVRPLLLAPGVPALTPMSPADAARYVASRAHELATLGDDLMSRLAAFDVAMTHLMERDNTRAKEQDTRRAGDLELVACAGCDHRMRRQDAQRAWQVIDGRYFCTSQCHEDRRLCRCRECDAPRGMYP